MQNKHSRAPKHPLHKVLAHPAVSPLSVWPSVFITHQLPHSTPLCFVVAQSSNYISRRMTRIKRLVTPSPGKAAERGTAAFFPGRSLGGTHTLKEQFAVSHKVKHTLTMWSGHSTPKYLPRRNYRTCPRKTLAALFRIAKYCTEPRWPLTNIQKINYDIYIQYFLAIKRKTNYPYA